MIRGGVDGNNGEEGTNRRGTELITKFIWGAEAEGAISGSSFEVDAVDKGGGSGGKGRGRRNKIGHGGLVEERSVGLKGETRAPISLGQRVGGGPSPKTRGKSVKDAEVLEER